MEHRFILHILAPVSHNEKNMSSFKLEILKKFGSRELIFNSIRLARKVLEFHCMMHSSDEDIELCSVDRFLPKNTKIIKKFVKVRVR